MEAFDILSFPHRDIAAAFFLDDVRAASTRHSRLGGILEKLDTGQSLTALQQEFLRQHDYKALLHFALGELDKEAFCVRAQKEREARLFLSAAADVEEATKKNLQMERTHRKNAAIFAEQEEKLERRRKVRELPDRFYLPFVEREDLGRVNRVLRSVVAGQPIEKDDLVWLGSADSDYWTDELRKAHHENMAKKLSNEWRRTRDLWKAINACGHWRKAERSENGLAIAEAALIHASETKKPRSALLTTGGGALRDLMRLEEASRFGKEAHSLTPEDFRPCTLLGAVHIQMGVYGTGAEWYEKAEARGAGRRMIDRELQSILDAVPQDERNQIRKALKARDASRYDWL